MLQTIHTNKLQNTIYSKVFAITAHELKTPLSVLKALTQLYISRLTERNEGFAMDLSELQVMDSELDRLTKLINEMLDFSIANNGTLSIQPEMINLSEIIQSVIAQMQIIAPENKISYAGPEELTVVADKDKIKQVLVNLISNAVKYSSQNDQIEVSIRSKKTKVVVSIRDHGMGIPKQKIKYIFNKFYQVKRSGKGDLGLGLFLVKEIIRIHKGRIWVKSKLGEGSIFYFSLSIA